MSDYTVFLLDRALGAVLGVIDGMLGIAGGLLGRLRTLARQ